MVNLKIYLREYWTTPEGIVWFIFYINRQKVHFSSKVRCYPLNWDTKRMIVKSSDPDSIDKNQIIENIRARINNVFVKYRLRVRKLTREAFLRAYNRPLDYNTIVAYGISNCGMS